MNGTDGLRSGLYLCLGASAAVMAAAVTAEHGFGIAPCDLCLYQRVPHGVVVLLSVWGLSFGRLRTGLALCGFAFLVGAVLAFYHAGVQQHWWASVAACGGTGGGGPESTAELLSQLGAPAPGPACDQVDWAIFGVPVPFLNAALSLAMAGVALWTAKSRPTAH